MSVHVERTRTMIAVMQAYVNGNPIEGKAAHTGIGHWVETTSPKWDWSSFDYRVLTTPDDVDWSHVAPEWEWMARHADGSATLFCSEPCVVRNAWEVSGSGSYKVCPASVFSSYVRGTCHWKDSLVRRPECPK